MRPQIFTLALVATILCLLQNANLTAQNIALGKTVVATSSDSDPSYAPPTNVNDGLGRASQIDPSGATCTSGNCTRWASIVGSDNQSIYIDLATNYNLTQVVLVWEAASAKDFSIEVSNDALAWTPVQSITNNTSFVNTIDLTGYSGRYVKMSATARTTTFGYSLWEFEIYGTIINPLGPNLAVSAVASSFQNPSVTANLAVDGEGGTGDADYSGGCTGSCTFWSSNINDPEDIYVDLGSVKPLYQTILYWTLFNNAKNFTIDISDDASAWTTVKTVNNNSAYVNTIDLTGNSARYVRMSGINRNASFSYALYEFEVYGFTILPITLSDFRAVKNANAADIKWEATLDRDGNFVVERSSNGRDFNAIGKINVASGSNGISQKYSFKDQNPLAGKNFYRLKYTETGSASKYSKIVSVDFSNNPGLVVSPNPLQHGQTLKIDLTTPYSGNIEINLINTNGVVIYKQKLQVNSRRLFEITRSASMASGNYLLQIVTDNAGRQSRLVNFQ